MEIQKFILQNVRCFEKRQQLRLTPLTFLIGENSTGKSTVLGCLNAILNGFNRRFSSYEFNESPYELGAFTEIVRKDGQYFELGYTYNLKGFKNPIDVLVTFSNSENDIAVKQVRNIFPNGEVVLRQNSKKLQDKEQGLYPFILQKEGNNFIFETHRFVPGIYSLSGVVEHVYMMESELEDDEKKVIAEFKNFLEQNIDSESTAARHSKNDVYGILRYSMMRSPSRPRSVISVSPIRSKPKRTYDPINSRETPEGDDVPIYLMRLKRQGNAEKIIQSLQKFGTASGLFSAIDVKTYGANMNEPFQLQVEVRNAKSNLLDVGYGISQLLPILVRVFADERRSTMLLQQPEVHLHPRAQAELSSLFISAIKEKGQSYVIETHSDAMIDRARIELKRGNIKPEDLSLVYFEPKGDSVEIHNITCDEKGRLQNVPQGYRDFFIDEGNKLLGFSD